MPRTRVVTLAGKEYSVEQLNMKKNKEWRDSLTEPVNKIIAIVQNYKDIEINSAADILGLIAVAKDILFGSMDLLLNALFDYCPAMAADRERIEAEAYDDEAIQALGVAIGLAFPLSQLLSVWNGPAATLTSTNSALANGKSGTQKALARQKNT